MRLLHVLYFAYVCININCQNDNNPKQQKNEQEQHLPNPNRQPISQQNIPPKVVQEPNILVKPQAEKPQPMKQKSAPTLAQQADNPSQQKQAQPIMPKQEQPVPQQMAQPLPQQQAQPIPQRQAQPVPQQQAQPVQMQQAQPVPQQQAQPIPQQQAQPVHMQQAQPIPQQQAQPIPQQQEQPVHIQQAQPVPQQMPPVSQQRAPPVPQQQAQPVQQQQNKPVQQQQKQPVPQKQQQPQLNQNQGKKATKPQMAQPLPPQSNNQPTGHQILQDQHFSKEWVQKSESNQDKKKQRKDLNKLNNVPFKQNQFIHNDNELDHIMHLPSPPSDSPFGGSFFSSSKHFVSITVIVRPASKDCFFYEPETHFDVDFQVVKGDVMDIGLLVTDPNGVPVVFREPTSEASTPIHVLNHFRRKPFVICLDNRKASHGEKIVYMAIDLRLNWNNPSPEDLSLINAINFKIGKENNNEDIRQHIEHLEKISISLDTISTKLHHAQRLQHRSRNKAAVDRNMMEANQNHVMTWSTFQLCVMVFIGFLQTLLIRSLFDEKSSLYRLWVHQRM